MWKYEKCLREEIDNEDAWQLIKNTTGIASEFQVIFREHVTKKCMGNVAYYRDGWCYRRTLIEKDTDQ